MKQGAESARIKAIEAAAQAPVASREEVDALRELYLTDDNPRIRRAARVTLGQIQRRGLPATATTAASPYRFDVAGAAPETPQDQNVATPRDTLFSNRPFAPTVNRTYVEPKRPNPQVAKLMAELKTNPASSIQACQQLATLGKEAEPASGALVEVMMKREAEWREARLAATEALEKIFPRLQHPVWALILEDSTDMSQLYGPLQELNGLGPQAYGALPLVMSFWNKPVEYGLHIESNLLVTMDALGPRDPQVTQIIIGVLKKQISAGENCLRFAIDIVSQRGLPADEVLNLLSRLALDGDAYAATQLVELAKTGAVPREPVIKLVIQLLEKNNDNAVCIQWLAHFGTASKEAIPLLKRLKFEHPSRQLRGEAADALNLIDR